MLTNKKKLYGRRLRPTQYAPARVQEPKFTGLRSWPWQLLAHAPSWYQY